MSTRARPQPRPDIAAMEGYHSPQVSVRVRLNTNESPYPPPPEWQADLAEEVARIDYHRYPEIAKLDKGNCDFSGVVFPPVGPMTQMNYIDLHGCNLSGAVLRGMAANEADFSGADLSGADLTGGSYFRTDFRGANLTGARADPAGVFQQANFEGANLTGANFANAIVTPVNWRNTTCPDGSNSDAHGGTCIGTPGLETHRPPMRRAARKLASAPATGPTSRPAFSARWQLSLRWRAKPSVPAITQARTSAAWRFPTPISAAVR